MKVQYLKMHQVACLRKSAGNQNELSSQKKSKAAAAKLKPALATLSPVTAQPLYVCKYCNRAFTTRQKLAVHGISKACRLKQAEAGFMFSAGDTKSLLKEKPDGTEIRMESKRCECPPRSSKFVTFHLL